VSLVALYILATLDGAFCGYRAAAGRSALIDKRRYYRRAQLRGAALVQGAPALAGVVLICLIEFSPARVGLSSDLQAAAKRALCVYVPYAVVGLIAFVIRLLPSADLRSATSVFIFGPMTALRPIVALAGVVYGVFPSSYAQTKLLGITVLALMFIVQVSLDRMAARDSDASLPASPTP
jgi:hypothetical protein